MTDHWKEIESFDIVVDGYLITLHFNSNGAKDANKVIEKALLMGYRQDERQNSA